MIWFWRFKRLIYDPTIRRIGPMHRMIRSLAFRLSDIFLNTVSRLTKFEVPRTEVPSYFLFPYVLGTHEREVIAWYKRYIQPGMFVVDVGAYVGYHTVRFARLVGESGKVVAFEPYSLSFEVLNRNIQRAKLTNVVLERKAVGNQMGMLQLHVSASWTGNSLMLVEGKHFREEQVEVITLDSYFHNDDRAILDLVKIDVEGAELAVLQGMKSLIADGKVKAMIIEFYPDLLRLWGDDNTPIELLKMLTRCFDIYHIRKDGLHLILPQEIKGFTTSVLKWTNICAIKRD